MSLLVQWRWKMTFSTLALAKRTGVAVAFFFTFALKIIVRKSRYRVREIYCLEIYFFFSKGIRLLRVEARTLSLFFRSLLFYCFYIFHFTFLQYLSSDFQYTLFRDIVNVIIGEFMVEKRNGNDRDKPRFLISLCLFDLTFLCYLVRPLSSIIFDAVSLLLCRWLNEYICLLRRYFVLFDTRLRDFS